MLLVKSGERSATVMAAAMSAAAAISVCAVAGGPLTESSAWRLAASSLSAEVSATIHDVLAVAHTAVHADRSDLVAGRQAIRDTRREAAGAIGASVLSGAIGEGQLKEITSTAGTAIADERQVNSETRMDVHQTRQAAAGDIRTIVSENHDGSTVQAVRVILDTAQMDNAITRSAIAAEAADNKTIRRATASDVVTLRRSARAGDITKAEAAQQITAARQAAHQDIAGNRAQMVSSHKEITATRRQAAQDVAKAVHDGRDG